MILVDTSVWVDHLRSGEDVLADLLVRGLVRAHPFVIGELALGGLRQRESILDALPDLPGAQVREQSRGGRGPAGDEGSTAAFSKIEARKLLDAPPADTLAGSRDRAILSVGLQVGFRRAESPR